jgi:cobalt-precorrin-5B (C1)-methyltransferase
VRLQGGFGVGTVTMAGLGLPVGGPAINPVPRRNIEDNVRAVGSGLLRREDGSDEKKDKLVLLQP